MSEQKRESMEQIENDILADLLELDDQMSQYTFLLECGLELPEYPTVYKIGEAAFAPLCLFYVRIRKKTGGWHDKFISKNMTGLSTFIFSWYN